MQNGLLLSLAFLGGFHLLVVEVLASRVLAPYYGNTIYSWTAVLVSILSALSLGYTLGGRLSHRRQARKTVAVILLLTAGLTFLLPWFGKALLPFIALHCGVRFGVLLSALLLFMPVALALATLTPLLIEEQHRHGFAAGKAAGRLFAWSTVGSLVGALVTGFYLIPKLPASWILYGMGLIIMASGLVLLADERFKIKRYRLRFFWLLWLVLAIFSWRPMKLSSGMRLSMQSLYQQIVVYDNGQQSTRQLWLDRTLHGQVPLKDNGEPELNSNVMPYVGELPTILASGQAQRGLVIGGGAYLIPRWVLLNRQDDEVTVVELDPQVTQTARQYFGLQDDKRLSIIHQDGRQFLSRSNDHWHWIWVDAFKDYAAIPNHLLTQEFFAIVAKHLEQGGLLIINTIASSERHPLVQAIGRTLETSFNEVAVLPVAASTSHGLTNYLLIASQALPASLQTYRVTVWPKGAWFSDDWMFADNLALDLIAQR